MRGTLCSRLAAWLTTGIIPAHAGNTLGNGISPRFSRDHPRACGEHHRNVFCQVGSRGSSPRMRGTPKNKKFANFSSVDHPRACGEHLLLRHDVDFHLGSSPRMRGTLYAYHDGELTLGIIPAHAGNTRPVFPNRPAPRDHPRACGEHISPSADNLLTWGSSPRMRGTPLP